MDTDSQELAEAKLAIHELVNHFTATMDLVRGHDRFFPSNIETQMDNETARNARVLKRWG